ncbi:hypothetical protein BLNAU_16544 [Blattamonas nauphoetae]|uniref:Uncharacterized protein n=1 Tax=Blattamonas nauphoetae TaxID=2049346 RepID=A0ABQ9XBC0_9EUKA|nr:hypothetical protein BLNAU_16544 [Blattamonas nauphoetae]
MQGEMSTSTRLNPCGARYVAFYQTEDRGKNEYTASRDQILAPIPDEDQNPDLDLVATDDTLSVSSVLK